MAGLPCRPHLAPRKQPHCKAAATALSALCSGLTHLSRVPLQLPGSILVTPTSLEFVDLRAKVLPTEFLGIRTVKRGQLEQQQVSCPSSRVGPIWRGQAGESAWLWQVPGPPCTKCQAQQQARLHHPRLAGSSSRGARRGCGWRRGAWGPWDSAAAHHSVERFDLRLCKQI